MKRKARDTRDTAQAMPVERRGNHRRRSVSRPHSHDGFNPAQNERFGIHGIFERKELIADISEVGEHEICIPKSRILV